jgi:predicted pyridoxine 5'-phosphate oxidase superfamily flavin-nucleotide-binding protein
MTVYHAGSRALQDRFDTRRLADRIEERFLSDDVIGPSDREFIERMDMFFLATADAEGRPQCSYKGGAPGFVRVLDEHTIAFPSYDGNGMYLSAGNLALNPHVGLLFIDFVAARPSRLRLNGVASILPDGPLVESYPGAQFVVRVRATQVFPNCPRYIHRMALVERSRFVPGEGGEAPVPDWKRTSWACDVLPAGDPARVGDPGQTE